MQLSTGHVKLLEGPGLSGGDVQLATGLSLEVSY